MQTHLFVFFIIGWSAAVVVARPIEHSRTQDIQGALRYLLELIRGEISHSSEVQLINSKLQNVTEAISAISTTLSNQNAEMLAMRAQIAKIMQQILERPGNIFC